MIERAARWNRTTAGSTAMMITTSNVAPAAMSAALRSITRSKINSTVPISMIATPTSVIRMMTWAVCTMVILTPLRNRARCKFTGANPNAVVSTAATTRMR